MAYLNWLSCLKVLGLLIILSLIGCSISNENFNRPFSNQSGAQVVSPWCNHSAGPEELLLFSLNDTEIHITLRSKKTSQILSIETRSNLSHAIINERFSILQDGKEANLLETRQEKRTVLDEVDMPTLYLSNVRVEVDDDYTNRLTLQGLEITHNDVAHPIENITFTKDKNTVISPWNC